MKKKILIFTSTRAEYGLFRNIIKHLELSKNFNPVVVAAGTHLLKKFGSTINELQKDKIKNIISMPFLSGSSDNFNLTSNVGKGLGLFSNIIKKQKPDFIMILGDRFELFIPAITALITNIPLIHIHGGENTTGAMDQQVRNALTKISHIHMPSTMEYAENMSCLLL